MKKLIALLLVIAAALAFCSCGKENKEESGGSAVKKAPVKINSHAAEVIAEEGFENTEDFWSEKYPDRKLYQFVIDLGDYENHMFFGTDLISTFREWTDSAFNIEGYKTVGIYLVSPDETRYVTDLDADSLIIPRKEYSTAEFTEAVRSSMDPEKASGVGKWPRNVYTDVIPEPALGTVESWYIENGKFVALMTDVRADEAQEYLDLFADMGFEGKRTKNGFSGKNEEGFKVKAAYFDEQFEVSVEKP